MSDRMKRTETSAAQITVGFIDRLDTMQDEINAIELMVSAYFLGPEEFDEHRTANALRHVLDNLQDNLTATKREAQLALVRTKTA